MNLAHRIVVIVWLLAIPFSTSANNADDATPEQLEALKKAIHKVDNWLKKASSERSGLEKQLQHNEAKISKVAKSIHKTSESLKQTQTRIHTLEKQQRDLQFDLRKQHKNLADQVVSSYQMGNQPGLKLLLSQTNPQELGRTFAYFEYISQARMAKINDFRDTLQRIQSNEKELSRQNNQLGSEKRSLEEQQKKLQQASKERRDSLTKLSASIKGKQQELEQLRNNHQRLEQLLEEVEKAIANIPQPKEIQPFATLRSKLPWPSRGKVSQAFGERIQDSSLRSNGITIDASEGASVAAVHYGRVIFSDWIRGFGLMLIIDHGQGFMTIYGHNKSLLKETGEWVLPGDAIAYAGNSGGDNRTGLYFEIRKDGKPQNPSRWLSR